jgi:hypothetical protein
VKAATDLAKYVKLHSEDPEITKIELDSNQTLVQIIFAITKVTVERPVVILYRRGKSEYSGTEYFCAKSAYSVLADHGFKFKE